MGLGDWLPSMCEPWVQFPPRSERIRTGQEAQHMEMHAPISQNQIMLSLSFQGWGVLRSNLEHRRLLHAGRGHPQSCTPAFQHCFDQHTETSIAVPAGGSQPSPTTQWSPDQEVRDQPATSPVSSTGNSTKTTTEVSQTVQDTPGVMWIGIQNYLVVARQSAILMIPRIIHRKRSPNTPARQVCRRKKPQGTVEGKWAGGGKDQRGAGKSHKDGSAVTWSDMRKRVSKAKANKHRNCGRSFNTWIQFSV